MQRTVRFIPVPDVASTQDDSSQNGDDLLTFKEAMGLLKGSRSTIYRLMWSNTFPRYKVGHGGVFIAAIGCHTSMTGENQHMTQQQSTTAMSVLIETQAEQMLESFQQQQQRAKQVQDEQTSRKGQQAIAVLQTLISTEFEADFLVALSLSYEVHHDTRNSSQSTKALFWYKGAEWQLAQEFPQRTPDTWHWSIRALKRSSGYASEITECSATAKPLALHAILLLKLGEYQRLVEQQAQEIATKEQARQQEQVKYEGARQQEVRDRAERIAAADREHNRLRTELNALVEHERKHLWQWPEDTYITLYRLSYVTGISHGDEDDETSTEHGYGWTKTDQMDSEGYIQIEPERVYRSESRVKEIKLSSTHLPIFERRVVGSTEELPAELREDIRVSLPHVFVRCDSDHLDGSSRLTLDEDGPSFDEEPYTERAGLRPLLWVRELVDQTSLKATM